MHVITRMCRVFEVYMLTPPEPDAYAHRFPHFVQPTYAVPCATVTQKVRIRPPRPKIELISRGSIPISQALVMVNDIQRYNMHAVLDE